METEFSSVEEEKEYLVNLVQEWNENRLDMFALTKPNEDLEFYGVMRFYFQDAGSRVATKCIRVSSRSSVPEVMETLIEKFNPDMKMLSTPHYELYEIHGNNETRKIGREEKPLLVQVGWHKDNREGRFLLKSADVKISTTFFELHKDEGQLKRRLSRREKKELKKKRKEESTKIKEGEEKAIAEHLYNELPETSLTRSISNPEAVMRRRRQQKLEKRLKEFQSEDGQQTGGILKIFAEKLKPEIPYKTILVGLNDTTDYIVQDALEKFLLEKEDPVNYCLVMAMTMIPHDKVAEQGKVGKERVLRDDDCPLAIQNSWPPSRGIMTFHLRKKENVTGSNKDKKITIQKSIDKNLDKASGSDRLPYFLELAPDGKEINYRPKIYEILPNVTVVGSKKTPGPNEQYLQLFSSRMLAQHCVVANMGGVVTMTPSSSDADVHVDGQLITETTILKHGATVQFGNVHTFKYCDPNSVDHNSSFGREKKASDVNRKHSTPPQEPPPRSSKTRPTSAGDQVGSHRVSPMLKELILNEQVGSRVDDDLVIETTFGVDGIVETSPVKRDFGPLSKGFQSSTDVREVEKQLERKGLDRNIQKSAPNLLAYDQRRKSRDEPQLPASLTFLEQGAFFAAIISEVNGAAVHFKLAPTYTLYLACRYLQSNQYHPDLNDEERKQLISQMAKRIALTIQSTIQENDGLAGGLAFWIANASELLHFLKQDVDLSHPSQATQSILAHSVQQGFRLLVSTMQEELSLALPAFLDPSEEVDIHPRDLEGILNDDQMERAESVELLNWTNDDRTFRVKHPMGPNGRPISGEQWITPAARISLHGCPVLADLLYILSSAMSLLRRCRVNAALTIQLFSQLFHHINMWLFNKIVLEQQLGLCTRVWGQRLRRRLGYVEAWAERQGLELAADCHLCRVIQAAHLLEAPKSTAQDIAAISSTCFKLNSLQLRALLKRYQPDRSEQAIQEDLIESVVTVAEDTADELARSDGREVKLAEDEELMLPFLLPEDGYSCDIIRGVPTGLQEFLEPLVETELCTLSINPLASGLWTVFQQPYGLEGQSKHHMSPIPPEVYDAPEVTTMTIQKGGGGLGLSIVAAKGGNAEHLGIYIKAVVPGGAAFRDGRLEAGDQLIAVNGNSLIGVSQERAAAFMGQTGSSVTLDVCKHAAVYHGLATLLTEQSPGPGSDPSQSPTHRLSSHDSSGAERSPAGLDPMATSFTNRRWVSQDADRQSEESNDELDRRRREQKRQEEYERRMEDDRIRREKADAEEEAKREAQAARRRTYEEEMYRQEEEMFRQEELAKKQAEKDRRQQHLAEEERLRAQEERRQIEAERQRRKKQVDQDEERRQLEAERRRLEMEERERQRDEADRRRKEMAEERERRREAEDLAERRRQEAERQLMENERIRSEEKRKREIEEEAQRRRQEAERHQRVESERIRAEEMKRREADQRRLEQHQQEARRVSTTTTTITTTVQQPKSPVKGTPVQNGNSGGGGDLLDFVQQLQLDLDGTTYPDTDPSDLPPPPEDLLEDFASDVSVSPPRSSYNNKQQSPSNNVSGEQRRMFTGETNIDDELPATRMSQGQATRVSVVQKGAVPLQSSSAQDLEAEFQRRLEEDRIRKQAEAKATEFVEDEIGFKKQLVAREYQEEEERRQQIVKTERERLRSEEDGGYRVERHMQGLNVSQPRYNSGYQSQEQNRQGDWLAEQRNLRERQREEQERQRSQRREQEEEDRRRRYQEVQQRREQQEKTLQEYERHKRQYDVPDGNQRTSSPDQVVRAEFKEKATVDYQRRRETIDREIERKQNEFKRVTAVSYSRPTVLSVTPPSNRSIDDDDDAPPPPRPPPPSGFKAMQSSARTSPSPYTPREYGSQYRSASTSSVPQQFRANATYRTVAPPVSNGGRSTPNSSGTGNYNDRKKFYNNQPNA